MHERECAFCSFSVNDAINLGPHSHRCRPETKRHQLLSQVLNILQGNLLFLRSLPQNHYQEYYQSGQSAGKVPDKVGDILSSHKGVVHDYSRGHADTGETHFGANGHYYSEEDGLG